MVVGGIWDHGLCHMCANISLPKVSTPWGGQNTERGGGGGGNKIAVDFV